MSVCLKVMTGYPGVWSEREYQKDFFPPPRQKADPSQFATWRQAQPAATRALFVSCKGDARWGKVSRIYDKKVYLNKSGRAVSRQQSDGSILVVKKTQKYVICLDPDSRFAGNIYNNDDRSLIYAKLWMSLIYRPLHAVSYTLYNATLVHAAQIIINGIINEKPASEILRKVVCSLADIVRVPVYSVAILIVTIAGALSIPFHSVLAYDFRAAIGRLNRELGWGEKEGLHDYMPCMQPKINIMEWTLNLQVVVRKKQYEDITNPVLIGLDNWRT